MKIKTHIKTLVILLGFSVPSLSAGELENLRALCAEQEMQIRHLEEKIARLTDSPPQPQKSLPEPKSNQIVAGNTYTIKTGDNIERIAKNHKTSASSLYKINKLNPTSIIHPGQVIKLPASTSPASIAPSPINSERTHTIKSGETFYSIANQYNISVNQLTSANSKINYNALKVGQVINIPTASSQSKPLEQVAQKATPSAPILNNSKSLPIQNPTPSPQRLVKITKEISYLDFASSHHTTTQRLDELNDLNLAPSTVLARGSELYVPAQP